MSMENARARMAGAGTRAQTTLMNAPQQLVRKIQYARIPLALSSVNVTPGTSLQVKISVRV